ncbi:MAG: DUF1311 domain-containing protein [Rhizobiaceae bacterium]|nr:DUF1311 domain-containing protein [Rhizobiaceae bacterium]
MRLKLIASSAFVVALMACGSAYAQDDSDDPQVDCSNAQVQTEMNYCSEKDFDAADKALNVQYKKTRAAMQSVDGDLEEDQRGAEQALLKAQRAWVDYRDGECLAEGYQYEGGSMQPMVISGCKATLTRARTKELKALEDGPEGNQ